MHERIYVCHTFYHVYVTCLKELAIRREAAYAAGAADRERLSARRAAARNGEVVAPEAEDAGTGTGADEITNIEKRENDSPSTPGTATLVLSKMSTAFGRLVERARQCGLFAEVIEFDEKRDDYFEELAPLRRDTGNKLRNMMNRIQFCKRFPELEAPFVPVDFTKYGNIYVFCDSDPIGYYLNANRICYHAIEDGLNCLRRFDAAKFDNRGAFPLKKWMAEQGRIFIQNGYAKYCLDMEVNDISVIADADRTEGKPRYIEVPRKKLTDALTKTDKLVLAQLFIENLEELLQKLSQGLDMPRVLVLTECILDETEREKLFREIVSRYAVRDGRQALVMIKPHPRDMLDYAWIFRNTSGIGNPENIPDDAGETVPFVVVLSGDFPMEMLNFIDGLHFDAVVAVFTQTDAITFADEHISLADEFAYAAPERRQAAFSGGSTDEQEPSDRF